ISVAIWYVPPELRHGWRAAAGIPRAPCKKRAHAPSPHDPSVAGFSRARVPKFSIELPKLVCESRASVSRAWNVRLLAARSTETACRIILFLARTLNEFVTVWRACMRWGRLPLARATEQEAEPVLSRDGLTRRTR